MKRGTMLTVVLAVLMVAGVAHANGYYADKSDQVPDVNKTVQNSSCWLACAANLLTYGGWGDNAVKIYNDLTKDYGTANGGFARAAVKHWIHKYGDNVTSDSYRNPNDFSNVYNNFRTIDYGGSGATKDQYDYLIGEIKRCQLASVNWEWPSPSAGSHCMTLVGGDQCYTSSSLWHNSDDNINSDEKYKQVWQNNFDTGQWRMPEFHDNAIARRAFLICPGPRKPHEALSQYNVAYYREYDPATGTWTREFVQTGNFYETDRKKPPEQREYETPTWKDDNNVWIGNWELDTNTKLLYLLVDFNDDMDNTQLPGITIKGYSAKGVETAKLLTTEWADDNGSVLYTFRLNTQPDNELITFPNSDYRYLTGTIFEWDLATCCVPEPGTLALAMTSAVGLLAWLRRRRRRL
ncbi:MAG TPA: PEP-CTERM sorting domain-containing protein [Planctomycetota bacterium]|nr:PEP-CTERM sorting domain-containing protein [Planctomycetota bacterium]